MQPMADTIWCTCAGHGSNFITSLQIPAHIFRLKVRAHLAWPMQFSKWPQPKKKSKSKIVLRRKKNVSGRPVCPKGSVSASHYDRTDFRLTQNSKLHNKEPVPWKNSDFSNQIQVTEPRYLFSKGMPLYSHGWPYFSTWNPHLYQQVLRPLVQVCWNWKDLDDFVEN